MRYPGCCVSERKGTLSILATNHCTSTDNCDISRSLEWLVCTIVVLKYTKGECITYSRVSFNNNSSVTNDHIPQTRDSSIAEAIRNSHAWTPPSTGGNFSSSKMILLSDCWSEGMKDVPRLVKLGGYSLGSMMQNISQLCSYRRDRNLEVQQGCV